MLILAVSAYFLDTLSEGYILSADLGIGVIGGRLVVRRITLFKFFNR